MWSIARTGSLAFLLSSAPTISSLAQDVHHYQVVVSGMTTTLQEKQLLTHLTDTDPLGEYRVDRTTGQVEMKTVRRTDRYRFEYLLSSMQLGVVSFEEIGEQRVPAVFSQRKRRDSDMPIYMDTGDPVRDNQRYDAYKAAWIAAHPEQYEALTAPRPVGTDGGTDE